MQRIASVEFALIVRYKMYYFGLSLFLLIFLRYTPLLSLLQIWTNNYD